VSACRSPTPKQGVVSCLTLFVAAFLLLTYASTFEQPTLQHSGRSQLEIGVTGGVQVMNTLNRTDPDPARSVAHAVPGVSPGAVVKTIDLENGSVLVGNDQPQTCGTFDAVAVSTEYDRLFAACQWQSAVVAFNATSGLVEGYIDVGQQPIGMALDKSTGRLYVANLGSDNLSVISVSSLAIIGAIPLNTSPSNLTLNGDDQVLYVAESSADSIVEISPTNDSIVGRIALSAGAHPVAIAYCNSTGDAYVAERGLNATAVISTSTSTVIGSIPVGNQPTALACDQNNGDVYVATLLLTQNSNSVKVISGATQNVIATVTVGFFPTAIAISPDGGEVYVANVPDDNLTIISGTTQSVVGSISVGDSPVGLAFDSSSEALFVADQLSQNVAVVNVTSRSIETLLTANPGPSSIAVDQVTGAGYVANLYSGSLYQVQGSTLLLGAERYIGAPLEGLAVDGETGHVYVACLGCGELYDVNESKPSLQPIRVGIGPTAVALDKVDGRIYVANSASNNVSVVDTSTDTTVATISLKGPTLGGSSPVGVAFDQMDDHVYVALHGDLLGDVGNITIIDAATDRVVGGYYQWGGPGPSAVCVDPSNSEVYVADDFSNEIWSFNTSTGAVVSIIPVGDMPEGLAMGLNDSYLYVADAGSNNVTLINSSTNEVIGSVTVGSSPEGIAFDPENRDIYVANEGSGTLSVIGPPTYEVSFQGKGLPTGTNWSVTVAGVTNSTTTTDVLFQEPLGTYNYTVSSGDPRYRAAGGVIRVLGAPINTEVTFAEVTYVVTFDESGLPFGTNWSVTLSGQTEASTASVIHFTQPNGSYKFVAVSSRGWTPAPSAGTLNVSGANVLESVNFSSSPPGPSELLGLPVTEGYGLLIAIAAAVVLAVALTVYRHRHRMRPPT